MKKSISILVLLLAMSVSIQAQNATQAVTDLVKVNSNRVHQTCDFVQDQYQKVLDKTEQMVGKLYFTSPYRMAMHYTELASHQMIITEEVFYMKAKNRARKFKLKSNASMTTLSHILLRGMEGKVDQIAAETKATMEYITSAKNHTFVLTQAKPSNRGYSRLEFVYSKTTGALQTLKMVEPSGNYNLYTLSDYSFTEVDSVKFSVPE